MKFFITLILSLVFSTIASASSLGEIALDTLLNAENINLVGDVHSNETVASIYSSARAAEAKINNICVLVLASQKAKCTLWMIYTPMGETAIEYTVNLPGTSLSSNSANVSRGD